MSQTTARGAGTGADLYRRAKQRIPGGTQLLSKRPELFLPDEWPAYFSRAKGVEVWDLDGRKYTDMSIMSVGACIHGYANDEVDDAVRQAIANGTMCTLNAPEEVELADLLCELHPWAEQVRYARGGGESMAVAVRLARAATGRDIVAFSGYHGWHDWYLSANLAEDGALDGHLLPGLEPLGVPRGLLGTALPFRYNDTKALDDIVARNPGKIAAVILESVRSADPAPGFVEHARAVADRVGAALIFDEVTAGWRCTTGGYHLKYSITPDVAVFAKAISNGYPMGAIIGRRWVMEAAQRTFVSSTSWTDRIGPTAALASIKKHRRENAPAHLIKTGNAVRAGWVAAASRAKLRITVNGIPPLSMFFFEHGDDSRAMATLFTQEMLDRGYLAKKEFYATMAHGPEHVDGYLDAVDDTFEVIAAALNDGSLTRRLRGPLQHTTFSRLA